jgi:hypothetical protein
MSVCAKKVPGTVSMSVKDFIKLFVPPVAIEAVRLLRKDNARPDTARQAQGYATSPTAALSAKIDSLKVLAANPVVQRIKSQGICDRLEEVEFKVFSQFGDDGIIQYLVHNLDLPEGQRTFIEFGVQDYTESNTRFLLINNNWKGIVLDGGQSNIDYIRNDVICWMYDLTAVHLFIDKGNINQAFSKHGFSGQVGILSIDIDGNDYWIWECIDVVDPAIVIVEYNSVFGSRHAITIPYDPAFDRTKAHYSNLYWGCSLPALCGLAQKKGYVFVGCNSNGNNAYFVRKDKAGRVKQQTVESGYVKSRYRESRDAEGRFTYLSGDDRLKAIEHLAVIDLERGAATPIKDLPA